MTGVRIPALTRTPALNDTPALPVVQPAAPAAAALQEAPLQDAPSSQASVRQAPGADLYLLGGFGFHVGDAAVPLAPSPQRLVALLGLHDSPLHRGYIAGLLWGGSTEAHAQGSLRSTLWKLQAARPGVVLLSGDSLVLAPDVRVDIRRAAGLARALVTGRFDDDTVSALLEPRLCYELLPGWYEDWVNVERERHRQLSLHALEMVCEHLITLRRYGAAVLAGLAAVDRDPLRESAHRALIKVHLAEGNAGEAIRRYRQYEAIAARDLGVRPSPMMRSLLSHVTTL
jgi:DNA-binding SARP family transcriptional activator